MLLKAQALIANEDSMVSLSGTIYRLKNLHVHVDMVGEISEENSREILQLSFSFSVFKTK